MPKENRVSTKWPTFFGEFYNPEHLKMKNDLISFFTDYKKNNSGRSSGENYKLFESKYNLHENSNPAFKKLLYNFIAKGFLTMSNKANEVQLKELKKAELAVTIVDSWFIHYEEGGFVLPHAHSGCSWCCVYYVQLGEDANLTNGATYFQKPIPTRATPDFGSIYNKHSQAAFKPEEGKMIIWPHYLMHGSYPYTGEKNRIVVSANAKVSLVENGKILNSF